MPPGPQYDPQVLGRFLLGFDGTSLPAELARMLEAGLAGVVLYPRNFQSAEGLAGLCRSICSAAARLVLIGIDQEGGTRFSLPEPFTQWSSPSELGRLGDATLVESEARAIGLELAAAGVNLNFAPMLDLHVQPASPVTTGRSFGGEPNLVGRLGAAFVRGLRSAGVLPCAKHFPGHGDTVVDPHHDLPVSYDAWPRLLHVELLPFAAAVEEAVPMVMTAHILLPNVDAKLPASLSRRLLTGVLRERMGFAGVILADDVGMGAVARTFGTGEAAVLAMQAGTDLVMLAHEWDAVAPTLRAVATARTDGRLNPGEWQDSAERIEWLFNFAAEPSRAQPSLDVVGCAEHRALASQLRTRLR